MSDNKQVPSSQRPNSVPLEEKGLTSVSAQTAGMVIQDMVGGLPPVPAASPIVDPAPAASAKE